MNIYGIICEYNPFHNGHMYHIEQSKKLGADGIVCVMSGNYVQRGDFAIMRKHARAETAIKCGADLVIELPLPWSVSSAEHFAHGAVSILHSLGIISAISFGAECNNTELLCRTAKLLISDGFNLKIAEEYSNGISYASARERALEKASPELAGIVKTPNNILAIEYIKALYRLNSNISPVAVIRFGAIHDEKSVHENIASASFIRSLIENGKEISDFIPEASLNIYKKETKAQCAPVFLKNADSAILSVLKRMSASDFKKYADVSEGLEFRLCDAIASSKTLTEAIDYAKTKRYAHSRIRRILLNAFLDIDGNLCSQSVPYARILAFNDKGRDMIKLAKKRTEIPLITKPSSINKIESKSSSELLALERRADDIYSLFMDNTPPQGSTLTYSPSYVKEIL